MLKIAKVGPRLGVRATCKALGVAPASYYRFRRPRSPTRSRSSLRALSSQERQDVLDVLHEPRFVDLAPAEVYATLLDEEHYLCSEYYTRLQERIGWQTARVATARKLARIIYQMLRTNEPWDPAPKESKTHRDELRRKTVAATTETVCD